MNLPFIAYVEGSYFGDSDIFYQDESKGRDGTATADSEVHLLVLNKKDLYMLIEEHEDFGFQMKAIARKRREYHEELILKIIQEQKSLF